MSLHLFHGDFQILSQFYRIHPSAVNSGVVWVLQVVSTSNFSVTVRLLHMSWLWMTETVCPEKRQEWFAFPRHNLPPRLLMGCQYQRQCLVLKVIRLWLWLCLWQTSCHSLKNNTETQPKKCLKHVNSQLSQIHLSYFMVLSTTRWVTDLLLQLRMKECNVISKIHV